MRTLLLLETTTNLGLKKDLECVLEMVRKEGLSGQFVSEDGDSGRSQRAGACFCLGDIC